MCEKFFPKWAYRTLKGEPNGGVYTVLLYCIPRRLVSANSSPGPSPRRYYEAQHTTSRGNGVGACCVAGVTPRPLTRSACTLYFTFISSFLSVLLIFLWLLLLIVLWPLLFSCCLIPFPFLDLSIDKKKMRLLSLRSVKSPLVFLGFQYISLSIT